MIWPLGIGLACIFGYMIGSVVTWQINRERFARNQAAYERHINCLKASHERELTRLRLNPAKEVETT